MLKAFYLSSGLLGPLIRLNEPAFSKAIYSTLKSDLRWLFCVKEVVVIDDEAENDKGYLSRKLSVMDRSQSTISQDNSPNFGIEQRSASEISYNMRSLSSNSDMMLEDMKVGSKQDQTEELAPLFLFLASSFNVELVYVILKGITQFSFLHRGDDYATRRCRKLDFTKNDNDITLQLS
jgi:hypothetical protein